MSSWKLVYPFSLISVSYEKNSALEHMILGERKDYSYHLVHGK